MPPKTRSRRARKATPSKSSPKSSGWTIKIVEAAGSQIELLPKPQREHILNFIYLKLRRLSDPRMRGRALEENFAGFWRYRVNDYRIICKIDDQKSLVQIVRVGHRYDVYGPG